MTFLRFVLFSLILGTWIGAGCAGIAHSNDMPPARLVEPAALVDTDSTVGLPQPAPVAPMPSIRESTQADEVVLAVSTEQSATDDPDVVWEDYTGPTRQQIAAIQILLDREHYSPGVVDGIWGPKTETALRAWQRRHDLPSSGEPDRVTFERLGPLRRAFQTYVVSDADHDGLAFAPATWVGKSQVTWLGYETVEEALAERFHCSRAFLRYLNPSAAWPNPPPGTELTVPDVRPTPLPMAARIEIRLGEKTLRVYDSNDCVVALFPCSIGRDRSKRPRGEVHVVAWAENPRYYFDPAVFPEDPEARSLNRRLVLPPGPNNPVGVAWISLSLPGYGIHGTPNPEDIGKTESHGCFRLANWNAAKLIRMVRAQTPVQILD